MRLILSVLVFVVSGLVAHYLVLTGIPGFIMGKAHALFESQGIPQNTWVGSPRQTPETQRVVRPSPDLAYAICRFDTSNGPILISAPTWDGYASLSIFNDQTDNVFVGDLSAGSEFQAVIVHAKDHPPSEGRRGYAENGHASIALDGKGIALIRRLSPDLISYEAAASLVKAASCEQGTWR